MLGIVRGAFCVEFLFGRIVVRAISVAKQIEEWRKSMVGDRWIAGQIVQFGFGNRSARHDSMGWGAYGKPTCCDVVSSVDVGHFLEC